MPVRLVRKVTFSSGHRYWLPSLSPEENRALFGKWASPLNHGHNYVLEAGFEGEVDPETGMVVNIKTLDEMMDRRIVDTFDQRSINDEVEGFQDRPPSLENLLFYVRDQLGIADLGFRIADRGPEHPTGVQSEGTETAPKPDPKSEISDLKSEIGNPQSAIRYPQSAISLVSLRLVETPELWGEWTYEEGKETMTLTRTYEFAASHRLYTPQLSEERNQELFGKCANPSGHGHNYKVEVTVSGDLDPMTGMMVDLVALDDAVNRLVVERYDHHNLNQDLPEFQGKVTTSEVVANEIWRALAGNVPAELVRVRLFETDRSWFEVTG